MINKSCPCCNSYSVKKQFRSYNNVNYNICKKCNTYYQNPLIQINYEFTDWENLIDPDNKVRNLKKEKEFKIKNWYGDTIDYLNNNCSGKILDIGPGLGFFLSALNSRKWKKHGLEESEQCVRFIRQNYDDINIKKGSILKTKYENEYFDVVFFYHVFEHLSEPLLALDKIFKILKPNGLLIIGTPNNSCFCSYFFQKNFRLLGPEHYFITNSKQLKKILVDKNFNIFKIEYPYFKTEYFNLKNLFRLFLFNKISPAFYGNIMTFYAKKI